MHGGEIVVRELKKRGVKYLFTLCGGHVSPILVAGKAAGLRIVDTRHEATAVFAADAVSRLTGVPGVAVVTAGPGVTNTITALKNAQMAQSPLILLGGATATLLKGRGALQDIDQMALVRPHVKWAGALRRVKELAPAVDRAFEEAVSGIPGPVFLEMPLDLLFPREVVAEFYGKETGRPARSLRRRLENWYIRRHLRNLFSGAEKAEWGAANRGKPRSIPARDVRRVWGSLRAARKPVILIGSQAVNNVKAVEELAAAVENLQVPVYLSGMARGLLGANSPLQFRHQRRVALTEADWVLLAGVPSDFRLEYGRQISGRAFLVSVNLGRRDLKRNRRPQIAVEGDPGTFLRELARRKAGALPSREEWFTVLRQREAAREKAINEQAAREGAAVNPLFFLRKLNEFLAENSILVADGGDFVGSAAYVCRPRQPLSWLDPGPFGTLGVGAGFALGAKISRPESEVWIIYGDGAAGFSLLEMDTFVRHRIPVIAVIGNDGGWAQIARDQVDILKDDVATVLRKSDYHRVARALGAEGIRVDQPGQIDAALVAARNAARSGVPVVLNVMLDRSDFRKGSVSV